MVNYRRRKNRYEENYLVQKIEKRKRKENQIVGGDRFNYYDF